MAAKNEFLVTKIWKNTFPKEFFIEIWLKLGDCDYKYIVDLIFFSREKA